MSKRSRLLLSGIIGGAVIASLLVLGAFAFRSSRADTDVSTVPPSETSPINLVAKPIFSIEKIAGISDVTDAVAAYDSGTIAEEPAWARNGDQASLLLSDSDRIRAAVLPHHTLVGPKLMSLWSEIAAHSDPSVIVIISPNHENRGDAAVQTTHGVWTTPFGDVATDDALVDRLRSLGTVSEESDSFVNEHGIGTHVPYLAELFPGVPIVPIIAKSTADLDDARSLALVLQQLLPEDALVVSSIDFCHYLPEDTTDKMDAETLAYAVGRRYEEIERLHSDHLDTPFGLISYFLWNDKNGLTSDLVWQQTSHRILGDPNAPGTSYLVFFSHSPAKSDSALPDTTQSRNDSITFSAAGDIMLGRSVATALGKTTVGNAFGDAASVFAGSDLAFANLESVLTDATADTGKQIFFKGDPARVDVLQYLGLTHVSVANNHVDDYGHAGWADSVANVSAAGIVPVGGYANDGELVVSRISTASGTKTFGFLAYEDLIHQVDVARIASEITEAKTRVDVLVVSFHWGVEYQHQPTSRQTALAHAAIDAGADVILGSHPHVLQGIETYNGGLILYSLGNFVFDQVGEDENESVVAKIRWDDDGTRSLELVPMRIVGTFPRQATEEEAKETLDRIASWSELYVDKWPFFW